MQTFHQLFDETSSTFTYLLIDAATGDALLIDPVDHQLERDLQLLQATGARLAWVIETHAHADHITSAGHLALQTGAHTAAPSGCDIKPAQKQLIDGDTVAFGKQVLRAIHTPGHTAGSMSYLWEEASADGIVRRVFTGDALLIDGCGRTDFQSGDAGTLYDSLTRKLFELPDDTLVYPAHDYKGRTVSTIGHERAHNSRVAGRTREQFVEMMRNLNLPRPKLIDVAVPANQRLGLRDGESVPHGA
ncbi:putative hydroxyacylglutathione hydrolase [Cupriavidus taiwanensis]|uniref:Hydroxyacylglutathione hydrolase n=1 Tax=Cupriavidus taiwanensis TaxID=164546 RepID=A0A375E295_9BURK|nr:MBL fold metallo-hydrolase [Cupriavidus taiwanensis]SOZ58525.1 putative hydroxyacylglutathione hydrolase [Cupriavidus taiwanensis]SOZ59474.1 putative hydroxyacylglutathione hydrolase [Cupriavidus taiwanensis]SOZ62592.1 putative hydroxyacylglutathione hydrolase [Cupriavidus taiwanensis]SOZ99358.1 putative hydroxyacylglutathione hydrolase [Cupriavidus taiwanensis]SPA06251.1 putative hydroxyacylglutathione hydrolase [Cupriavidus taiwanensis]